MATEITNVKLNTIITEEYKKKDTELVTETVADDTWLLSITSRFAKNGLSKVEKISTAEDVLSGDVQKEIDSILKEEDQIAAIIKENTTTLNSEANDALLTSLRSSTAKTIGFVQYSGKSKINATTDTTAAKACIQANTAEERDLISNAIDLMAEWLDEYIANYNVRVAEGRAQGDSELKLSFLLEIRKAIENIDFPIGFGTYDASSNTLGQYSSASTLNDGSSIGYDPTHLHVQRSILLNPNYFMPERPYKTYDELYTALTTTGLTSYTGVEFLVDDEAYNNYCTNYVASTLWHEIIHSTHIGNEMVTYYSTDAFDDDWAKKKIEGVSAKVENLVKQLGKIDLKYTDGTTRTVVLSDGLQYEDLLISHYLDGFNDAVNHGYAMIQDNQGVFDILYPGVTKDEFKAELENFAAYA